MKSNLKSRLCAVRRVRRNYTHYPVRCHDCNKKIEKGEAYFSAGPAREWCEDCIEVDN